MSGDVAVASVDVSGTPNTGGLHTVILYIVNFPVTRFVKYDISFCFTLVNGSYVIVFAVRTVKAWPLQMSVDDNDDVISERGDGPLLNDDTHSHNEGKYDTGGVVLTT